jgi:hydrogenase-4 component E
MYWWLNAFVICIVLTNIMFLASARLGSCIRIIAFQGAACGLVSLFVYGYPFSPAVFILAVAAVILKGIVFPILLRRSLEVSRSNREVEVFIGYPLSLLSGLVIFIISLWLGTKLTFTSLPTLQALIPLAFATMLIGLFVIITRVKAITQVLGYLTLENGIYIFGAGLIFEQPFLVELAILLDIFVAVFVMGIAIFHISNEFDHMDTHKMSELSDYKDQEEMP